MEWYRSGHNELHWNCSSRESGPWVRIPLTPPYKKRQAPISFEIEANSLSTALLLILIFNFKVV